MKKKSPTIAELECAYKNSLDAHIESEFSVVNDRIDRNTAQIGRILNRYDRVSNNLSNKLISFFILGIVSIVFSFAACIISIKR